jgi:hypothetical protein
VGEYLEKDGTRWMRNGQLLRKLGRTTRFWTTLRKMVSWNLWRLAHCLIPGAKDITFTSHSGPRENIATKEEIRHSPDRKDL